MFVLQENLYQILFQHVDMECSLFRQCYVFGLQFLYCIYDDAITTLNSFTNVNMMLPRSEGDKIHSIYK